MHVVKIRVARYFFVEIHKKIQEKKANLKKVKVKFFLCKNSKSIIYKKVTLQAKKVIFKGEKSLFKQKLAVHFEQTFVNSGQKLVIFLAILVKMSLIKRFNHVYLE